MIYKRETSWPGLALSDGQQDPYFPAGVESLPDDEVDDDPGEEERPGQLVLEAAQAVLDALVLLKHPVPTEGGGGGGGGEREKVLIHLSL